MPFKRRETKVKEMERTNQNPETGPKSEYSAELIAAEKARRVRLCGSELDAILAKYDCRLEAVPTILNGLIVGNIQLVTN